MDILLIAGDLFHRQPLLRELKELDYMFSRLIRTKVVIIAGNHDYLKTDSYYRTFQWKSAVTMFLSQTLEAAEFKDLKLCVYGLSYEQKEIKEPLYDDAYPQKHQPIEILLAHGGDEKHIPFNKNKLSNLGYDYVALGHIHRPAVIEENHIYYAGSLEPTDKNDIGIHGYVKGEITKKGVKAQFVPFASRQYIHMDVEIHEHMTGHEVKELVAQEIKRKGIENIYKVTLTGYSDTDILFDFANMDVYGNVIEFADHTVPAYDYEKLLSHNQDNLLGKYIESFKDVAPGSMDEQALFEGVRALIETKRG